MKNQHIKIGCEIFVIQNNRILLGKRKNSYGAGQWGLPGGHVEYNEKLIDSAKRELKEELGIEAKKLEICCITDDLEGNNHYVHVSFLLIEYEGTIQLMEPNKCEEWKFFDLNNLPENIFSAHEKIIETYFSRKFYK